MSVECDSIQKNVCASIPADAPRVWRHTELVAPRPATVSHAHLAMSATFKRPDDPALEPEPIRLRLQSRRDVGPVQDPSDEKSTPDRRKGLKGQSGEPPAKASLTAAQSQPFLDEVMRKRLGRLLVESADFRENAGFLRGFSLSWAEAVARAHIEVSERTQAAMAGKEVYRLAFTKSRTFVNPELTARPLLRSSPRWALKPGHRDGVKTVGWEPHSAFRLKFSEEVAAALKPFEDPGQYKYRIERQSMRESLQSGGTRHDCNLRA